MNRIDLTEATPSSFTARIPIPLSQATTLCDFPSVEKPNPDLAVNGEAYIAALPVFTSNHISINSWTYFRQSEWTIVAVCAYCIFYQIFACTLFTPVLQFRLEDLGIQAVEANIGYLSSIWAAGCVAISPIAGWLPLKYKNKRIQLLAYIAVLMGATLLFAFVPSITGLMAGRFLHGVGASGLWTLAMAIVNDNVDPSRAGRLIGLTQIGFAIGNSASPTMGGALYGKMGWLPLCYFALGMGALNVVLCFVYLEKPKPAAILSLSTSITAGEDSAYKPANLRSVVRISLFNPKYCIGITVGLCWGAFANSVLYTALPLYLKHRYSLSSSSVGYSFLAIAGPYIFFAPLAGWMTDRLGARPLMLACLASFTAWNGLMCIEQLPYACFLTILVGVGASASFVSTPILVYWTQVDRIYGSRVGASLICGIYCTATSLASLIFPLMSSAILGQVGISLGWKILLGLLTGCLLACFALAYRCMHLPDTPVMIESPANMKVASEDV